MTESLIKAPEFKGLIRGGSDQAYDRMRSAMARNLPDSSRFIGAWKDHAAIVVGGGPSLAKTIGQIKRYKRTHKKTLIVAPNKSHDWLVARGIVPDIATLMDPAPWLIDYITPRKDVLYFLGSALDPKVLDKFEAAGAVVVLTHFGWDPLQLEKYTIEKEFPGTPAAIIWGGSTSGMRALSLLALLGIDKYQIHGLDSCKAPGTDSMYAYDKPVVSQKEKQLIIRNRERGRSFSALTNDQMRVQVDDFADMVRRFSNYTVNGEKRNIRLWAAGDGAIPWMCFQAGEEAREQGLTPQVDHIDPAAMRKKYRDYAHYDYHENRGAAVMPGVRPKMQIYGTIELPDARDLLTNV